MGLMKWEPKIRELEPFRGLREEMDRLFDDFGQGWALPRIGRMFARAGDVIVPSADLEETDSEFILRAELPGVRKGDLDVNLTEREVTIKGERKEAAKAADAVVHRRESVYGTFNRTMGIPAPILPDKVVAKLESGVLTLTMPKAEPSKHKAVKVKVE